MNQNVNKDTQNQSKTSKPVHIEKSQAQQSQDNLSQPDKGSQMGFDQSRSRPDRDRLRNQPRINPSQQGDE